MSCYQLACGCWVTDVPGHGIGGYLGCIRCNTLRAELEAAREVLKLLKDDWDTCRSIGANVRAVRSATEGFGS